MGLQPFEVAFGISYFCRFTKCWKYENSSETSKRLWSRCISIFLNKQKFHKANSGLFYILFCLIPPINAGLRVNSVFVIVLSALCKIKKK